jgi:DNA-binding NtrC family response regulator
MGAQDDRALVCLHHFSSDCSVVSVVQAAGWLVHSSLDLDNVRTLIEGNDIRVGLVLLTGAEPSDWLRQVEGILSRFTGLEWVAIVPGELLDSALTCDFLAAHFLDFHTLPVDTQRLLYSLGHAYGMATLSPVSQVTNLHAQIIGSSKPIRQFVNELDKVARVDAPLLITGESGTGKELAASTIHAGSARRDGPFIAVNCAELSPTLIHAELFGYERGAFTGAHKRKHGYLERAGGGTIFLDEVGDLPVELQVLLLRFLQEKTIRRVGGTSNIHVDARVIAATHVNLRMAVQEGRFREDLFHRLNVLHIHVPPLRERSGDIEQLAHHFLEKYSGEFSINVRGFSHSALEVMQRYNWPGNIRELMNRVRRALVMCDGRVIAAADLGIPGQAEAGGREQLLTLGEARDRAERAAIIAALRHFSGNATEAAALLEVSRATFYRLLERHGLVADSWKDKPAADPVADRQQVGRQHAGQGEGSARITEIFGSPRKPAQALSNGSVVSHK